MKLRYVVWREIIHRKLNFALSLVAVVLAVACAVSVVTLLRAQDQLVQQQVAKAESQTKLRVSTLEKETQQRVKVLDDEIRKITKQMGFNILILPAEQNLAEFHSQDFAAKTMPQSYVDRLAESRDVVTINHLRPALIRKLKWPEQNRQIVLMGISGVVPFLHRDPKQPLALPVPEGKMNVGSVLAAELSLEKGQTVELQGSKFEIDKIFPQRGNVDDITVWIDLAKTQEMLEMQGRINMIQALECNCASIDRLAEIETEISGVLGSDVQVIELATKAIARAKARTEVKKSGAETLAQVRASGERHIAEVKKNGESTLDQWTRFAAVVIPTVIAAAGLWVALLSLANVRQRRAEIGIWRALGWRSRHILTLFLSKAVLVGLLGAVIGLAIGATATAAVAAKWADAADNAATRGSEIEPIFLPSMMVLVLAVTPLLAILASWLPALSATTQDPADVLREE